MHKSSISVLHLRFFVFSSLVLLLFCGCRTQKNTETASSSACEQVSQSSMMQSIIAQDSSVLRQLLSIDSITVEYTLALTDTALRQQQRTNLTPTASASKIVLKAKGINLNTDRINAKTVRSLSKSEDSLAVRSTSQELTKETTQTTNGASPVNTTVVLIVALVVMMLLLFISARNK